LKIVAVNISDDNYPGTPDPDREKALQQPAWGETSVEIPPMAITDFGYKFSKASEVMDGISKDFSKIRNNGEGITAKLEGLQARYKGFKIDDTEGEAITAERKEMIKQIEKIYRRIDDGKIFPTAMTQSVEKALINFDDVQKSDGKVLNNLKDRVYAFATGQYESMLVPIPIGHIWDSLMRVLAGLFFGILLGVPLGLYMGLSRFAKGFFDPLIELYRPIPPLAWAPLILTIFGIQDDGKIFLLFMVAFAIMVISARTGATGTQLSKIHAAHSLGATKFQIIRKVILPNSLPEILTGIRIAIGVCWGTLVAAEMLAGTTGIGFVENVARKQSDYEIIWMTILLLGLLGLMFDLIMRFIIHRTIPWRGKG